MMYSKIRHHGTVHPTCQTMEELLIIADDDNEAVRCLPYREVMQLDPIIREINFRHWWPLCEVDLGLQGLAGHVNKREAHLRV